MSKPADSTQACVADLPSTLARSSNATTGTLVGFDPSGPPLVETSGATFQARTCTPLHQRDLGRQVVLVFEDGNQDQPIVLGVVQPPTETTAVEISADGRIVSVRAAEMITLTCGEASITLKRDGEVVIRGKHVVTHAAGVNRIRGGSVQLN